MKKSTLWIVVAALIIGAAAAAFIFSSNAKKEPKAETMPFVCYVDLGQLAQKGALNEFITAENRSLIGSVLSSEFDNSKDANKVKSIIKDFDEMGIDTQSPIYGYLNEEFTNFIVVAKVLDIERVESTLSFVSNLSGVVADIRKEDGIYSLDYDEVAVAYDESMIAIALGEEKTSLRAAKEAVERSYMDISIFGNTDIAILANIDNIKKYAYDWISDEKAGLKEMYDEGYINREQFMAESESWTELSGVIDSYAQYFEENANVLISTTFDEGRMTVAYEANGINNTWCDGALKPVNMDHLENLSKDAYAVLSMGIAGEKMSEYVRNILDNEALSDLGIAFSAEERIAISIGCDAIETIDGSVTLALDNIDGDIVTKYDYYWDEYNDEPSIESVDALLLADVTDNYIIANIAQFAGDYLDKVDATHYAYSIMDYNITMGQDDNLFHIGVNMLPKAKASSALDAEWAKDIKDSYSYLVFNVDAFMDGRFMTAVNQYIEENMTRNERKIYRQATDMVSYIYVAADSYESSKFVVVFDDKKTNALKQINTLVLPALINECMDSLY